jgi:hypothetical protein
MADPDFGHDQADLDPCRDQLHDLPFRPLWEMAVTDPYYQEEATVAKRQSVYGHSRQDDLVARPLINWRHLWRIPNPHVRHPAIRYRCEARGCVSKAI